MSEPGHTDQEKRSLAKRTYVMQEKRAVRDSLTGLFNRRYLFEQLKTMDQTGPVAMFMMDLDHFKNINDTYGHLTGDEVLISVTRDIQNHIPIVSEKKRDIIARFGGEEIVVLMPGLSDIEVAKKRAEQIRESIENLSIFHNGREIKVTLSIGIATRNGSESLINILEKADKAVYLAKENGRNRVEVVQETHV